MIALLLCGPLLAQDTDETAEGLTEAVEPTTPDRSAPPAVTPPTVLDLPEATVKELRPGLTLSHMQVDGVRKVEVMAVSYTHLRAHET